MHIRKCGAIIVTLAAAGTVRAEPISWKEALAELRDRHPLLIAAAEAVAAAECEVDVARARLFPRVNASVSAGVSGDFSGAPVTDRSVGVSGVLSLFSGYATTAQLRLRQYELAVARERYRRTLSDAVYALRRSYVEALWARENVALARSIEQRRRQNLELIRIKYEAGREDRGSLLRVEADVAQSEYETAAAVRRSELAVINLLRDLGRPVRAGEAVEPTGGLETPSPPEPVDPLHLATRTPEYRISVLSAEVARERLTSARAPLWPSLGLSAGVGRSAAGSFPESSRWNASVSLFHALLSGGADLSAVRSAEAAQRESEHSLQVQSLRLAASVAQAWTAFQDAVQNVSVREKYVDSSKTQADIVHQKYLSGIATYQEWYTTQNDVIAAQRALLAARRDAALAEAAYRNLLGLDE